MFWSCESLFSLHGWWRSFIVGNEERKDGMIPVVSPGLDFHNCLSSKVTQSTETLCCRIQCSKQERFESYCIFLSQYKKIIFFFRPLLHIFSCAACSINCLSCVFTLGRSAVILEAANGNPGNMKNKMLLCTALKEMSYLYCAVCSCVAHYLWDAERPLKFVVP